MKIHFKQLLSAVTGCSTNPLLLLLIGSTIGSYVIPRILTEATELQAKNVEKRKIAEKLLTQESLVNQRFNTVLVSLEIFHQFASPRSFKAEQKVVRDLSRKLYMEFNEDVWWQHQTVLEGAYVWQLVGEQDREYIQKRLTTYNGYWNVALAALDRLWKACLSDMYKPGDPMVTQLAESARRAFDNSRRERDSVIRFFISKLDTELSAH